MSTVIMDALVLSMTFLAALIMHVCREHWNALADEQYALIQGQGDDAPRVVTPGQEG